MEIVFALAIGVLTASGTWLLLRPRTFQVIMGLALLSYAVNLFIFGMGRLVIDKPPIIGADDATDPALYADPVPQALVLTAIVIGFAHHGTVSGGAARVARLDRNGSCRRPRGRRMNPWLQHLSVAADRRAAGRGRGNAARWPNRRRAPRMVLALAATLAQLAAAITLLCLTTDSVPGIWPEGIGVYAIGGWPAPFGIVLVVDRLSALMITLNAALALPVLVYSFARWDRLGVHYHSLLQFLLMGLNGAFLTGDLFNLFVFFEVLLAASYGLLLHGGGTPRVKAALHYIVVNLAASFAVPDRRRDDLRRGRHAEHGGPRATAGPRYRRGDRGIAEAGARDSRHRLPGQGRQLAAQFLAAGSVCGRGRARGGGVLDHDQGRRLRGAAHGSLLAGPRAAPFGGPWLFYGAIATMVFGIVGMLAAQQLPRADGVHRDPLLGNAARGDRPRRTGD